MPRLILSVLKHWLPLAIGISGICFIIYSTIQQDIRMGANDPQIQVAEDSAILLNGGQSLTLSAPLDVSKSLALFTIIYNRSGSVIHSSALLNGSTPLLPQGVLQVAKQEGENRLTWQPQNNVRLAIVVVPYNSGYVVVGRNMREIELREGQQLQIVTLGFITTLLATLLSVIFLQTIFYSKKK